MPRKVFKVEPAQRASGPGRPRKLNHQRLLDAALAVMDREGYGALTMRSLAEELGTSHSTLYNYIGRIEDIEAEALHTLSSQLPLPQSAKPAELRKELMTYMVAARQLLLKHPQAMFPTIGSAPWKTFFHVTISWVKALEAFAPDRAHASAAHTALLAYISVDAEHERTYSPDYPARFLKEARKYSSEITKKPLAEQLDIMIEGLLPGLHAPARRKK